MLHVGNEIAASHAPPGYFRCVLSTVPALDRNLARAPAHTTVKLYFLDGMGRESLAGESFARSCIVKGAHAVGAALDKGERTLVHCSFGQNRSTAICICWAILYRGWSADDAVEYVVQQNKLHRQYYGQSPCSNPSFIRILRAIADEHGAAAGGREGSPSPAKKPRIGLLTSWLGLVRGEQEAPPLLRGKSAPTKASAHGADLPRAHSSPSVSLGASAPMTGDRPAAGERDTSRQSRDAPASDMQ